METLEATAEQGLRYAVRDWWVEGDMARIRWAMDHASVFPAAQARWLTTLRAEFAVELPAFDTAESLLRIRGHAEAAGELLRLAEECCYGTPRAWRAIVDRLHLPALAARLGELGTDILDGRRTSLDGVRDALEAVHSALAEMPASQARFKMIPIADTAKLPQATWLLPRILPARSLAALVGPTGSMKSFWALDLVARMTSGLDWYGHRLKSGSVIYAAGEGAAGISKRFQAWQSQFGDPPDCPGLYLCPEVPKLLVNDDIGPFMRQVDALPEPPILVVLDTLAWCLVGGEENSAKDMGIAIDRCSTISRRTGATVLIVHHTGKMPGNGPRGSSALPAGLETLLSMTADGSVITLSCTKQKDAEPFKPMSFTVVKVPLGMDEDGAPVDSCYIQPQSPYEAAQELTGTAAKILEFLRRASVGDNGASRGEILDVVEIKPRTFHAAATVLITRGIIERRGQKYYSRVQSA